MMMDQPVFPAVLRCMSLIFRILQIRVLFRILLKKQLKLYSLGPAYKPLSGILA